MHRLVAPALLAVALLGACAQPPGPADSDKTSPPSPPVASTPATPDEQGVTHDLTGTRWVPVLLRGKEVTTKDGEREQYIALNSQELTVVGNAGCNRLGGGYQLAADALTFSQMVTTRMACPELDKEAALLEALESAARWRILGAHLELFDSSGNLLARFEARNL